eukprot:TRINITY_DN4292_c0_g2_i1.p1 TRINITY_DN4292_c0_g2~~TRINITY_DN4292_c0_g2_i1.p1  ORF type:complete len:378 (-),score=65.79 TRINITY_DN4292_c0_g2_i1:752-1885(-)
MDMDSRTYRSGITHRSDTIRFGILGCANIARKIVRALHMVDGTEAYAIGSRSLAKAQAFAEATRMKPGHNIKCYGHYEELLDDPLVDVVYIPLPSGLHREWVLKAASKGKHVLLEKPVALELQEFDDMRLACAKAGVQLMDGTMFVHHPRMHAVKEIIKDKKQLGDLVSMYAVCSMFRNTETFMKSNIRTQKHLDGLGALGGNGWYCIRAMLWAMDYKLPKEVYAWPHSVLNDKGVIMQCGANLFWDNGVVGNMEASFMAAMRLTFEVSGTHAVVSMPDFVLPASEDIGVYEIRKLTVDESRFWGKVIDVYAEEVPTELPQEALMVEEMARLVRGLKNGTGKIDRHWEEIAWKTQLVLNAIDESIRLGGAQVIVRAT